MSKDKKYLSISHGGWVLVCATILSLLWGVRPVRSDDAGWALSFDGAADYVQLGDTGDLMQGTGWVGSKAVSVWIQPLASTSPSTHPSSGQLIAGNDRPRLFGITRATYNEMDKIWVWNADNDGTDVIGIDFVPGEWFQVTLVHDAGLLHAYKNGVLVGTVPSGDTVLPGGTGDGDLYLGGNGRTITDPYFNGRIDEARFWNSGLDAATIQAWAYQVVSDAHPNWLNLAAYYQMSDGVGTILTDNSAYNHPGLLSGGMDNSSWVTSGAFLLPGTPTPPPSTPTATNTGTAVPPTATPTETPVPPTATSTQTSPPTTATATPTAVIPTPLPGVDYALSFDGNNDFVELAETANMMGPGWETTKTVSLWVKPASSYPCTANTPAHCDAIFGDRARWWGISQGSVNGLERIWLWNYDGNVDMVGIEYALDEWVHIALVHQGGTLLAYKNGVLIASVPSGATLQPNTGAQPVLHLGGIINASNRNWTFAGLLDEVRLWNVARSQTDIQQDMSQPLTGAEPGLMAYYQMTDGAGTSVTDNSGHGWTGTMYDGARAVPPDGQYPLWISPGVFGGPSAPTATATAVPPTPTHTATPVAPTFTPTPAPPTATPSPTPVLPTPTATAVGPTPTSTAVPPTPTPGSGANYALSFDGLQNYMQLGSTAAVMGTGDWASEKTVSLWVKPAPGNSPAVQPSAGALLAGNDRPRSFGITRATYNGSDQLWVWNGDTNGADWIGIPFTPGEWTHVALVHTNGILYAYKDGVLAGSVASGATYTPGNMGTMYVGGTGRGQYFAGDMDEVRIWQTGLDVATLQSWMYQELTAGHPSWVDLNAYYQMNEGAGTAVTDSSSHTNDASLYGSMDDENWVVSGAL